MDKHCNLCGRVMRNPYRSQLYCKECAKWLKSQNQKDSRKRYESFNSVNAALIKDLADLKEYNKEHKTNLSYGRYKAVIRARGAKNDKQREKGNS